ncbi:MAG TPA: acetate kinase [Candidatus Hydrothermia bacterium]|nr:acetate kinase [Candidatus Hydrothermia bacterium]
MKILTLNCGSSSIKYQVYDWGQKRPVCKGIVERVAIGNSFILHELPGRDPVKIDHECPDHKVAIELVLKIISDHDFGVIKSVKEIDVVSHRVVHGGEKFTKSVLIDREVIKTFKELTPLAPLHNPANVMGIEAAMKLMPDIPHVAVMDTAFLQTMPKHTYLYAVPYEWYEEHGVRKYGFHGTSHLYVSRRAAALLKKKPDEVNLITLHIGNGASATAIKNGKAYDHSMGFTPLQGLIMGTRSGDIDPAVIPYIMDKLGISLQEVMEILNKRSGVLGITEKYTDRRDVELAAKRGDKRAKLAMEMEAYRIRHYIGAYVAALGRIDAIVFTAGVGEMSFEIRAKALEGLESIGIKVDEHKNREAMSRNHEFVISTDDSHVKVFVIPTDEELVLVEDAVAILEGKYDVPEKFTYSFGSPDYVNAVREEAYRRELEKRRKN